MIAGKTLLDYANSISLKYFKDKNGKRKRRSCVSIHNALKKYNEMNEKIKTPEIGVEYTI